MAPEGSKVRNTISFHTTPFLFHATPFLLLRVITITTMQR